MKLVVRYSECFNIDVIGGCVIVNYPMDCTLEEVLNKNKEELIRLLNLEINNHTSYFMEQLLLLAKLNSESNIVGCFDLIDMDYPSEEILSKFFYSFKNINIPVVFDAMDLDDDYLLENIGFFDNRLKENGVSNISYVIKQCVDDRESHNENVSYPIEDVLLVLNYIKDVTSNVKKFNLSPLEQVMFIYDYVKDRCYTLPDEDDSYIESRDMVKILTSDKIVCLGFATLFKNLLDNLGINNEVVTLYGTNKDIRGHARNMVVVKDDKYNLDHILYFDATWDSKQNNNGIIDENRYECFGRRKLYFELRDKGRIKETNVLPFYLRKDDDYSFILNGSTASNLLKIKRIFRLIDWEKYFLNLNISDNNMYKISYLMSDDLVAPIMLGKDEEFCLYVCKECCKLLNRELPDDNFLRCLYTVRRVEHSINPDKYSFDRDDLIRIYDRYTGFDKTSEFLLLKALFGDDTSIYDKLEVFESEDITNSRNSLLLKLKMLTSNIDNLGINNNASVKDAVKILKK